MKQNQISYTQDNELHAQILEVFHSVEYRRYINKLGPKIFCQFQRFALVALFKRSGKSFRRFVAELYESKWPQWLKLREIPSKSSLHRWFLKIDVSVIREALQKTVAETKPSIMSIDATGIDSWQRSRHYERRIGESYMPYAKLDVFIDVETKLIFDHVLRLKPRHDTISATQIFKRNTGNSLILADRGYDSEPLHELARESGFEMFAPVRKSSRKRPKGRFRRRCMSEHPEYSKRNAVESVIHSLKAVRLPNLRSKLWWMKKKECALAILIYNIEQKIKIANNQISIKICISVHIIH
jgi:hypothetical protein